MTKTFEFNVSWIMYYLGVYCIYTFLTSLSITILRDKIILFYTYQKLMHLIYTMLNEQVELLEINWKQKIKISIIC